MATKVRETRGDIFNTKEGVLVNTGSREARYWSRLPGIFNRRFGVAQFMSRHGKKDIYYQQDVTDRQTGRKRDVITLIVKEYEGQAVDEDHLAQLLYKLKDFCEEKGIKHLVMPRLCCGVHGCRWPNVKKLLGAVFDGSDIRVTVKTLDTDD